MSDAFPEAGVQRGEIPSVEFSLLQGHIRTQWAMISALRVEQGGVGALRELAHGHWLERRELPANGSHLTQVLWDKQ